MSSATERSTGGQTAVRSDDPSQSPSAVTEEKLKTHIKGILKKLRTPGLHRD